MAVTRVGDTQVGAVTLEGDTPVEGTLVAVTPAGATLVAAVTQAGDTPVAVTQEEGTLDAAAATMDAADADTMAAAGAVQLRTRSRIRNTWLTHASSSNMEGV